MSILSFRNVSKRFGGLLAVNDVTFEISANSIHSIVGPNGAGKTTILNIASGILQPSSGEVVFQDKIVSNLKPYQIARLGISRTFQNLQICVNMSAVENVMLGAHKYLNDSVIKAMLRTPAMVRGDSECRAYAENMMRFVGLEQYIGSSAGSLPYGALKRLEIARALVSNANLILLDEPAAGLNPRETDELAALIRRLPERAITVVLVEHDMRLVMGSSQKITVLNYGRVLAEGSPERIRNDPAVVTAYLGEIQTASVPKTDHIKSDSTEKTSILKIRALEASYGNIQVLRDISIDVDQGQLVALIGANGAGKTTLLSCVQGLQPVLAGQISFMGSDVTTMRADKRKQLGICQSPEGRQLFAPLTVEDNLRMGGFGRSARDIARDMTRMFGTFPILAERRNTLAGMLSGGQQQMLSIARALMGNPKLLLLDEPSMGLAPKIIREVFEVIAELRRQGTTILLVEQNAREALSIADKGYVLEAGRIVLSGSGEELLSEERIRAAYLGK